MNKKNQRLPTPVQRALTKIGEDIRNARRRRRIQAQIMAERTSITRTTLHKLERGDPGVSFGTYMTVLFVLGMLDRLTDVTDARHDQIGIDLTDEILPKRIRYARAGTRLPEYAP